MDICGGSCIFTCILASWVVIDIHFDSCELFVQIFVYLVFKLFSCYVLILVQIWTSSRSSLGSTGLMPYLRKYLRWRVVEVLIHSFMWRIWCPVTLLPLVCQHSFQLMIAQTTKVVFKSFHADIVALRASLISG